MLLKSQLYWSLKFWTGFDKNTSVADIVLVSYLKMVEEFFITALQEDPSLLLAASGTNLL